MSTVQQIKLKKPHQKYTPLGILWLFVEYASLLFFGFWAVIPVISCFINVI